MAFLLFPKLPPELQDHIWALAIPPRLPTVRFAMPKNAWGQGDEVEAGLLGTRSPDESSADEAARIVTTLLKTSYRSRQVAQRRHLADKPAKPFPILYYARGKAPVKRPERPSRSKGLQLVHPAFCMPFMKAEESSPVLFDTCEIDTTTDLIMFPEFPDGGRDIPYDEVPCFGSDETPWPLRYIAIPWETLDVNGLVEGPEFELDYRRDVFTRPFLKYDELSLVYALVDPETLEAAQGPWLGVNIENKVSDWEGVCYSPGRPRRLHQFLRNRASPRGSMEVWQSRVLRGFCDAACRIRWPGGFGCDFANYSSRQDS